MSTQHMIEAQHRPNTRSRFLLSHLCRLFPVPAQRDSSRNRCSRNDIIVGYMEVLSHVPLLGSASRQVLLQLLCFLSCFLSFLFPPLSLSSQMM